MNNLKLQNKILLILLLPIISIIVLSINSLYIKYEEKNSMTKTINYLEFVMNSNSLLVQLQKERSYSLNYISSYGNSFKDELKFQIKQSDKYKKLYKEFTQNFDASNYDDKLVPKIEKVLKEIKQLKNIRKEVLSSQIDEEKTQKFYTNIIDILLTFSDDLVAFSNNGKISKYSESLISLINTSEKAYKESTVVRNIFDLGRISSESYYLFSSLVASQDTYLSTFKKNASKEELKTYEKILTSSSTKEVEKLRKIVFLKNTKVQLLSHIKEVAGYGGLIHNFKNYVLRGDRKYLKKVEQLHTSLIRDIKKYSRIKNVTIEEKKLLKKIKRVFDSYLLTASELKTMIDKGSSVEEIDAYTSIDDSSAIKAINSLSKNIFGGDIQVWDKYSIQRIKQFEDLQNQVSNNLLTLMENRTSQIQENFILLVVVIIVILTLIFVSLFFMTKKIVNSMMSFKEGLEYFFSYVSREKEYLKEMPINGSDEFALMTIDMNAQIVKIKDIIEQDKKVVIELSDVVQKVSNGFLEYKIHQNGATNEVESLRVIINEMIESSYKKVSNINKVLDGYARGDYSTRLKGEEKDGLYGDFGTLFSGSVLLGQSISQLVAMITNAGKELESNTLVLSKSSHDLSTSANQQASSLEETAASIEQITGNMKSSSNDVIKMLTISDELNSSAVSGNTLASKTSTSMDEINEKVKAISEAISVIDKIAFQTNILSLNAAVEAATAGEAGKGFAVVAQEVRNLAGRSAEAANTIKQLVEEASYKSNEGKNIANDMIKGYDNLSEKIIDTKDIIDSVSTAIKEQEEGMIQVNAAVNELDHMTQKNAATSANIGNLSNEVANLSSRLIGITAKAKITEKYYDMVDDIDLIQQISRFKNNNIKLKKEYFGNLDSYNIVEVVKNEDTELGRWIIDCERDNRVFVNSNEWKKLKERKSKFHELMQKFMDSNARKANNYELSILAKDIELLTGDLFSSLNDIAVVNTKLIRGNSRLQIQG